jgi:hypothetical protein
VSGLQVHFGGRFGRLDDPEMCCALLRLHCLSSTRGLGPGVALNGNHSVTARSRQRVS